MTTKEEKQAERLKNVITEYTGKVLCSICKKPAVFGENKTIYGRPYGNGMAWICSDYPACDSYVGCHDDGKPLGTPANKELRHARNQAHQAFDKLWRIHDDRFLDKAERSKHYANLARWLAVPTWLCHIGMFDEGQCERVLEYCKDSRSIIIANLPTIAVDPEKSRLWLDHVDDPSKVMDEFNPATPLTD